MFKLLLAGLVSASMLLAVGCSSNAASSNNKIGVIETEKGVIKFTLFEDKAPITTTNFIELAKKGFYDGLTFHRVEPGFVIQGGDPKGDGTGGSDKTIKLEIHKDLRHDSAGVVAMARSSNPDSASCQFYITLDAASFLDDNYAVFGKVFEGLDVVKKIKIGDKMTKVYIVDPEKKETKENKETKKDKKK